MPAAEQLSPGRGAAAQGYQEGDEGWKSHLTRTQLKKIAHSEQMKAKAMGAYAKDGPHSNHNDNHRNSNTQTDTNRSPSPHRMPNKHHQGYSQTPPTNKGKPTTHGHNITNHRRSTVYHRWQEHRWEQALEHRRPEGQEKACLHHRTEESTHGIHDRDARDLRQKKESTLPKMPAAPKERRSA